MKWDDLAYWLDWENCQFQTVCPTWLGLLWNTHVFATASWRQHCTCWKLMTLLNKYSLVYANHIWIYLNNGAYLSVCQSSACSITPDPSRIWVACLQLLLVQSLQHPLLSCDLQPLIKLWQFCGHCRFYNGQTRVKGTLLSLLQNVYTHYLTSFLYHLRRYIYNNSIKLTIEIIRSFNVGISDQ